MPPESSRFAEAWQWFTKAAQDLQAVVLNRMADIAKK